MENLIITGELVKVLNLKSGVSKAGKEWKTRDFLIEYNQDTQYPRQATFTLFGDKSNILDEYKVGDVIEVHYNIDAREYNGRYFNNVTAWQVSHQSNENSSAAPVSNDNADLVPAENDDLPF